MSQITTLRTNEPPWHDVTSKVGTIPTLNEVITIITTNTDLQLIRHNVLGFDNTVLHIKSKLLSQYAVYSPSKMLLPGNIRTLLTDIFSDTEYRDFIMDISVVSMTSINDMYNSDLSVLIDTVVNGVCLVEKTEGDNCAIPSKLANAMSLDRDVVYNIFIENNWLLVYYLLISNFHKTSYFSEMF